jgi:hypothetical protein
MYFDVLNNLFDEVSFDVLTSASDGMMVGLDLLKFSQNLFLQDIQGVDYIDPKLLEGTEHEHLLLDLDVEMALLPDPEVSKKQEVDQVIDDDTHDEPKASINR